MEQLNNTDTRFCLEHSKRTVHANGRETVLQQKAWEVLCLLVSASGEVISRDEIIAAVWDGNHWTGNRGLNQAMWSIRTALADDARNPIFVRTLPRRGYQWLLPPLQPTLTTKIKRAWYQKAYIAPVMMGLMLLLVDIDVAFVPQAQGTLAQTVIHAEGTTATLKNNVITVVLPEGCKAILQTTQQKTFSNPSLSADGKMIAFHLNEPQSCRLITLDFETGKRQEFGSCLT